MSESGFLSLGLTGYAIAGLLVAVLAAGGVASCEHKGKIRAQENAARIQGEFDGFVAQTKRLGDQALAEKAAIETKWKEVLANAAKRYQTDLAGRDAALRRLRERPAARPDGGAVPVIACRPAGLDGPGGEFIPLEEYRQLEARAYDDALRLTRLQEWVRDTGHPVQ